MSLFRTISSFQDEASEAFRMFAHGKRDEIQLQDLPFVLRSLGFDPGSDLEQTIVSESNAEETGVVPWNVFSSAISSIAPEVVVGPEKEVVLEAFLQFDRESNGFISGAELRHLLSGLEDDLEETKIEDIIKDQLLEGDGQLNYHDFVQLLSHDPG